MAVLPSTEQIVRDPHARIDVPPVGRAFPPIEVPGRQPRVDPRKVPPGIHRVRVVRLLLRGAVAVEGVDAHAHVDGPAVDGPLILGVEPRVPGAIPLEVGRRPLREPVGHPVAEPVVHVVAGVEEVDVVHQLLRLHAGLEVVRTGDVRHREALAVAIGVVGVAPQPAVVAVGDPRPHVVDQHFVRFDARHQEGVPLRDRDRAAGLEQQAARLRRRPRELQQAVGVEAIAGRRLLHPVGVGGAAVAGALLVVGEVELVVVRRLPGDAAQVRVVPLQPPAVAVVGHVRVRDEIDDLPLRARRREVPRLAGGRGAREGALVPVDPGVPAREAPAPPGEEEPQPVAHDRSAQAQRLIPHLQRRVRRVETGVLQLLGQVLALHAVVGEEPGRDAAERVAAPPSG